MLKIEFHNPDFPDDVVFDLGGIAVPNGGSVELDEEAELKFYATYGMNVKDHLKGNPMVDVSGTTTLKAADKALYPDTSDSATIVDTDEEPVEEPEEVEA